ncbi:netrin receptor unc5c [Plakobranchus ocellatus]|uniref:Netrin receptor unc5c n=1 Tax=Plakobranchus ocellatus TaxID=259542 RepID=A0AAV3Z6Q7_9GAST|nr:netrin receptor unc5c [Plakobranchus ocellatus]
MPLLTIQSVDGGPGEWTAWTESSKCLAYCGRGLRKVTRTRKCDNPAPFCGGRYCEPEDLRDMTRRPCINFPCGPICPDNYREEYVSQYTPAQGFYILCRKTAGFLKPCPYVSGWFDIQSPGGIGYNIYSVCYGHYRYG